MKNVKYLLFPDETRLASWHNHDYKAKEFEGKIYFIDGGQSQLTIRTNSDNTVAFKSESIGWIREDFAWTSILKVDKTFRKKPITRKLKNLSDKHLVALLEWVDEDTFTHNLFTEEIKYRQKQKNE